MLLQPAPNVVSSAKVQSPLLALNRSRERRLATDREATSKEVGHAPV